MKKKILGLGAEGQPVLITGGKQEAYRTPVTKAAGTLYYLIDCSISMFDGLERSASGPGEKIEQVRRGAEQNMRAALAMGYHLGVISFGSDAAQRLVPTRDMTALVEALRGLRQEGSTNMAAALRLALDCLVPMAGSKAIVLATDGAPDDRDAALEAGKRLANAGVRVITIGTQDADAEFLGAIATEADLAILVTSDDLKLGFQKAAALLLPPARPN
jgi:Mg-chelatase subunit ChlD